MFLKLFKRRLTAYIFGLSFILSSTTTLLRGLGFGKAIISGVLSGLIFVIIWGVFLKVLQLILSSRELEDIFLLPKSDLSNESEQKNYSDEDDLSDDLTIEEIYQDVNSDNISEELQPVDEDNNLRSVSPDELSEFMSIVDNKTTENSETVVSEIGADGKFALTVDGHTVRAKPEDGAKASRKLLKDEKQYY
ncbi:MAG: hypothetical protein ACRCTJ_07485 [Brevinema sp.]